MLPRSLLVALIALWCAALSPAGCIAASGDQVAVEVEEEDAETLEEAVGGPLKCADPAVLPHAGSYYLTCTGGGPGGTFPIYSSTDMKGWKLEGHVFAGQHPWGKGKFWAPEIHHAGAGFVVYYSALDSAGRLSVGAAHSALPAGPYQDIGAPLVQKSYSVIDAHLFNDGAKNWLYYKRNENGKNTTIYVQQLDGSGLAKIGNAKAALNFSQAWEGELIEAPWVVKRGDWYFLFYTGDLWCNQSYSVNVARSHSPTGPFVKHAGPILKSGSRWRGPGHVSVVRDHEAVDWMLYHAYDGDQGEPTCKNTAKNPPRLLRRASLSWKDGWPVVKPPVRECSLRCCNDALKGAGKKTRQACRDAWPACKNGGFTNRIRWGDHIIYDKPDEQCK